MNYTDIRPNAPIRNFICDELNDIANLPTQTTVGTFGKTAPTGSKAFVIEDSSNWMLSNAGEWKKIISITEIKNAIGDVETRLTALRGGDA